MKEVKSRGELRVVLKNLAREKGICGRRWRGGGSGEEEGESVEEKRFEY